MAGGGTTQGIAWVKHYAEDAVDLVPQLLDKVDSGTVQYALPLAPELVN